MSLSKYRCKPCTSLYERGQAVCLIPCENVHKLFICQRCSSKRTPKYYCFTELNLICDSCYLEHERKQPYAFHNIINIKNDDFLYLYANKDTEQNSPIRFCKLCKTYERIEWHEQRRHSILTVDLVPILRERLKDADKLCDTYIKRLINCDDNIRNNSTNFMKAHEVFLDEYVRKNVSSSSVMLQHMNFLKLFGMNLEECRNSCSVVYLTPHLFNAINHASMVYNGGQGLPDQQITTPLDDVFTETSVWCNSNTAPKHIAKESVPKDDYLDLTSSRSQEVLYQRVLCQSDEYAQQLVPPVYTGRTNETVPEVFGATEIAGRQLHHPTDDSDGIVTQGTELEKFAQDRQNHVDPFVRIHHH